MLWTCLNFYSYCDVIVNENISGAVLAHCNISELKNVLMMNFGDWEIFQLVLISLRDHEKREKKQKLSFLMKAASTAKASNVSTAVENSRGGTESPNTQTSGKKSK